MKRCSPTKRCKAWNGNRPRSAALTKGWFLRALSVCACHAVARRDARQALALASAYARVTPHCTPLSSMSSAEVNAASAATAWYERMVRLRL